MKTLFKVAFIFIFIASATTINAQTDSTKAVTLPNKEYKQIEPIVKPLPPLKFIPYFFSPRLNFLPLKNYSLTSNYNNIKLIEKSKTADNAMLSIYYSLENDRKMAEQFRVNAIIGGTLGVGAMVYQIVNSEKMVKKAQEMRTKQTTMPLRH
jgi:hypothetical protein